jgi:hypothetical protein
VRQKKKKKKKEKEKRLHGLSCNLHLDFDGGKRGKMECDTAQTTTYNIHNFSGCR